MKSLKLVCARLSDNLLRASSSINTMAGDCVPNIHYVKEWI
jgi:hypothetical protein